MIIFEEKGVMNRIKRIKTRRAKKKKKKNMEIDIKSHAQMDSKTEEQMKMKEQINWKEKQILEKDNEIKKKRWHNDQELLKIRADVEGMKNDLSDKEKQLLSRYDQLAKMLQEENEKLSQYCEQLSHDYKHLLRQSNNKEEQKEQRGQIKG
ncbi:hypothetical protein RFI_15178, partial [Reticulomyxa filosa]